MWSFNLILVLLTLFALPATQFDNPLTSAPSTPQSLIYQDVEFQLLLEDYLDQGLVILESGIQAHRYPLIPQGVYEWGTAVYVFEDSVSETKVRVTATLDFDPTSHSYSITEIAVEDQLSEPLSEN